MRRDKTQRLFGCNHRHIKLIKMIYDDMGEGRGLFYYFCQECDKEYSYVDLIKEVGDRKHLKEDQKIKVGNLWKHIARNIQAHRD